MKNNKKGISLIVLVITIVVIIILTAAIVLSISQNNPIDKAKQAVIASDIQNVQDSVVLYTGKFMADNLDSSVIYAASAADSKDIGTAGAPLTVIAFDKAMITTSTDFATGTPSLGTPLIGTAGNSSLGVAVPTEGTKNMTWTIDAKGKVRLFDCTAIADCTAANEIVPGA